MQDVKDLAVKMHGEIDSLRKMVSCIAIIDPRSGLAWMFDATPDFAKQYNIITKQHGARLAGIFLTHAPYRSLYQSYASWDEK